MRSIEFDHEAAQAELIGFASSEDPDRPRWTELKVWFLHNPPQRGRAWLSEVYGCSRVPGETPRIQRLNVGSLERALKLFADSDIGVVASEEARDWEDRRANAVHELTSERFIGGEWVAGEAVARFSQVGFSGTLGKDELRPVSSGVAPDGRPWNLYHVKASAKQGAFDEVPADDAGALEWLYGETDGGKATFASMLAKDFDLAPRTVTTALASNTPIRIPLRLALRFFDVARFRAWRKRRGAS